MNQLKLLSISLVAIFSLNFACIGQNSNYQQDLYSDDDLEEQLPPLEKLIEIALQNSPLMKYNDLVIEQGQKEIKLEKRAWQNHIGLLGNYTQGDQIFLLGPPDNNGGYSSSLNGYRFGLNILIPISTFTMRKTRIQISELQVDQAETQKLEVERQVKNQVILEYYQLVSAYRVMKIKSGSRESAVLQGKMAEKYFSEGTISLEDYSNVDQAGANSEVDFELSKTEYLTKYKQFEQLIGVSLDNLKR
jgi:outer membrane protein TolC